MSPKMNQTPGAVLPSVVGFIVTWLSKIVSLPKLYSISPVKLSKFFPLDLTHTAYLSLMVTVMCLADATGDRLANRINYNVTICGILWSNAFNFF